MEEYPHILKENYPIMAGCPCRANKGDTIKSFQRFCPINVQVEEVEYFQNENGPCEWHVIYNFIHKLGIEDARKESYKIKEPHDVQRNKVSLTSDGMLKIIFSVLSCTC